jgi:hypothetical protein
VLSLTVNNEILGFVTSFFITLKFILDVEVLPAESLTETVLVLEVVPKP